MKVRNQTTNKVNVITLGCSKNIVDSEVLMGQLVANDFDVTHEAEKSDANIVIINTCGFIDNAKQESIDTILRYAEEKEAGRLDKLYVTGCLSQRYKDELEVEIPQVDAYFGTLELPHMLKVLNADYKHELIGERLITTPRHYAYFKIAEGCNRPCSFCAIPLMRGKHVDRKIEDLVREAKRLASMGTKEQVFWVAAGPIVAPVTHKHAIWNLSVMLLPSNDVCPLLVTPALALDSYVTVGVWFLLWNDTRCHGFIVTTMGPRINPVFR